MNSYIKFYQQSGQMIIVQQQCFTSSNLLNEGKWKTIEATETFNLITKVFQITMRSSLVRHQKATCVYIGVEISNSMTR